MIITLKNLASVCTFVLCITFSTTCFAQEAPAAAPPTDEQSAQKVPTMQEARQLLQAEEFEDAAKAFHAIVRADPDNANAWHFLGFSLHASGNLTDALPCHLMAAEFAQTAPIASYNVACVYSLRNKADKAFKWLEKARELGFRNRAQIDGDSDLDNIRTDPRFAEFVEKLGNQAPGVGMEEAVTQPGGGDNGNANEMDSAAARETIEPAQAIAAMAPQRQMDFWVGTWDVFVANGAKAGTNVIEPMLNGRIIFEHWKSSGGGEGKSINYYDAARKQWVQVWVDAHGGALQTWGAFKDGAMRTQGERISPEGTNGLTRSTLTPNPDGTVRQFIENSDDEGKTWTVYFDGLYRRASA